jgi:hypothetical protein
MSSSHQSAQRDEPTRDFSELVRDLRALTEKFDEFHLALTLAWKRSQSFSVVPVEDKTRFTSG